MSYRAQSVVSTSRRRERQLITLAGIAAIAGGVLFPLMLSLEDIFYQGITEMPGTAAYTAYFAVMTVMALCLLAGVIALHSRVGEHTGHLERAGALLTATGLLSITTATILMAATLEGIAGVFGVIGFLSAPLGMTILGIALWRSRASSRAIGGLLALAFPLLVLELLTLEPVFAATGYYLSTLIFTVPFGIAWILVGRSLLVDRPQSSDEKPVLTD